jgi:hypothetical protein
MTTPQGSYEPVRYFPDQVPIGIHPDGRWIVVCLMTQDARRELRTFLERHLTFLAALTTWTLRVVIPAHMAAYGMRFVDDARRGLRWRFDGQFRDDLRWYFETRRAGGNPDAVSDDDERAHRARLRRFSGLGFSVQSVNTPRGTLLISTPEATALDLVSYVGQTRVRFGIRTSQHLAKMLSGEYSTYAALRRR